MDEQYAETKSKLRREIGVLREKVLSLIAANEALPDIERLERQEFILDMEEHQRLQAEDQQLIKQVGSCGVGRAGMGIGSLRGDSLRMIVRSYLKGVGRSTAFTD